MLHTDKSITLIDMLGRTGINQWLHGTSSILIVYQGSAVWQTTHTTFAKFERRVF